jgi:hypothetical protein
MALLIAFLLAALCSRQARLGGRRVSVDRRRGGGSLEACEVFTVGILYHIYASWSERSEDD